MRPVGHTALLDHQALPTETSFCARRFAANRLSQTLWRAPSPDDDPVQFLNGTLSVRDGADRSPPIPIVAELQLARPGGPSCREPRPSSITRPTLRTPSSLASGVESSTPARIEGADETFQTFGDQPAGAQLGGHLRTELVGVGPSVRSWPFGHYRTTGKGRRLECQARPPQSHPVARDR